MVHPRNRVGTDGTVLFHGADDSDDGADKHLTHLSQAIDCHLTERSKQNEHVVGNKDNGVDDGVDDGVNNNVDNSDDGANKHLTYLSQVVDCHLTEISKQNERVVGNKDNGVDNGDNNGDDNNVDNSDDGANKHLIHLSQ
eukprot:10044447-Ditylum_brightwellii.AAC.1